MKEVDDGSGDPVDPQLAIGQHVLMGPSMRDALSK